MLSTHSNNLQPTPFIEGDHPSEVVLGANEATSVNDLQAIFDEAEAAARHRFVKALQRHRGKVHHCRSPTNRSHCDCGHHAGKKLLEHLAGG
jgi:hypothetical protein